MYARRSSSAVSIIQAACSPCVRSFVSVAVRLVIASTIIVTFAPARAAVPLALPERNTFVVKVIGRAHEGWMARAEDGARLLEPPF